jgi:hypothetical protein
MEQGAYAHKPVAASDRGTVVMAGHSTRSLGDNMKMFLSRFLMVMKFIVPALYIAGAIVIWLDFLRSNPDGLANIWIGIYTFPIVIIGTFLLQGEFPYVPGSYYEAHAIYFWPSVVLLALALFFIFHALQKIVHPAASMDG